MQELIAPVKHIRFEIEIALEEQRGAQPLPFPGMDKSGAAICTFFLVSQCNRGGACPFRHVVGDRTVVCKHWLRGLCKKGDECEFLHEYDMTKMPECYFFSKFGQCNNKECPFLHIDPNAKIKDCPWYDRGFCRHGPNCKNRHVRRVICQCFLNGFCLEGPNCKFSHPKFDIPQPDPGVAAKRAAIVCHFCGEPGHKAIACYKMPAELKQEQAQGVGIPKSTQMYMQRKQQQNFEQQQQPHSDMAEQPPPEGRRNLETVTCYKCGEKGHYANKCPKGHLAFLSKS